MKAATRELPQKFYIGLYEGDNVFYIKLGVSRDVDRRLKQIDYTSVPFRVRHCFTMPGNNEIEARVKKLCQRHIAQRNNKEVILVSKERARKLMNNLLDLDNEKGRFVTVTEAFRDAMK